MRTLRTSCALTAFVGICTLSLTVGCCKKRGPAPDRDVARPAEPRSGEVYSHRVDNPFFLAARAPLSTFSIDVDTASYSNVRRFLQQNQLPPRDAVRVEEFINYFPYEYPQPLGDDPIAISADVATCPWHAGRKLVRIGLQGRSLSAENQPPRNLVFLVDTSGSMSPANRLPLLKQALRLLLDQLTARDRVAIVAYAGRAGLVLAPTPADQRGVIREAIDSLNASGSTNGGEGIVLAYRLAEQSFLPDGVNRVILGTDGDFNVGVTSQDALVRLIQQKRQTGVYLSILGFGMGNLKDATMEQLAQHGNGQYAYIDSLAEARKVFVEDLANLVPIARDVKVRVQFNPGRVTAYRLIGYENRLMRDQDFHDDTKDAGDMGTCHRVTALYEIVPPGQPVDLSGATLNVPGDAGGPELLTVQVRYLPPTEATGRQLGTVLLDADHAFAEAPADFRFAAAVASFGMQLRESPFKGVATWNDVLAWARDARGTDLAGHRAEFVRLVETAMRLQPHK